MTRRSRHKREPTLDENGDLVPFVFQESDLEFLKLLAVNSRIRYPWEYPYLPTSYVLRLLGRDNSNGRERLRRLTEEPQQFLRIIDQGPDNTRQLIRAIDTAGEDMLREYGFKVRAYRFSRVAHELYSSLIAASFEYGADKHGLKIERKDNPIELHPDWPVFDIGGCLHFIEADMGTETRRTRKAGQTTIGEKFSRYLRCFERKQLRNARILFISNSVARHEHIIQIFKDVVDTERLPRSLARHFGFAYFPLNRFLHSIPELTDWAVTKPYQSPGHEPFTIK